MADDFTPLSHPAEGPEGEPVELAVHLRDVATRAETVTATNAVSPAGESLSSITRLLGWVHDFGKSTTWFQQHIDHLDGKPPTATYKEHAPLGAVLAYYALEKRDFSEETCLAGFVAVWWHHGSLPDVVDAVFERTSRQSGGHSDRQEVIEYQVDNISKHVPNFSSDILNWITDGRASIDDFVDAVENKQILQNIHNQVSRGTITKKKREDALSDDFYGLVLRLWSTLVLADKTSAAGAPGGEKAYGCTKPSFERLDAYVNQIESEATFDDSREGQLNRLRSQARADVLNNVSGLTDSPNDVATLTLPTGLGKTLTGLSAALQIRDDSGADRVIYALPFTSIIDQVASEAADIYAEDNDTMEGISSLLTVHHHLADTTVEARDTEEDLDDRVAGMLGESWRSGLTITTFVQLFESLAGPQNTQSMKLPALTHSVIILDEPQTLPHGWWKLIDRLVGLLASQYDATVIVMTATQPRLFDDDAPELVDNPEQYFVQAERVRYHLDRSVDAFLRSEDDALGYDVAARQLTESVESETSTLAICNTIDSARELTDHVQETLSAATNIGEIYAKHLSERGGAQGINAAGLAQRIAEHEPSVAVCHLTTRLRPVDRLTLIETIKQLTSSGIPTLVVATQLIEAGVDISFDHVYRDLAPLDSIVQAAGRCNRSFEAQYGNVTVWWLEAPNEQDMEPAVAVYDRGGPSLLSVTATALQQVRNEAEHTLSEPTVAVDGVNTYYRLLDEERDVGKADYVTYVDRAKAQQLGQLSLIDRRAAIDVLVCRTESEAQLIDDIKTAWRHNKFGRVDRLLNETKPMRISVPIYDPESDEAQRLSKELETVHGDTDLRWLDTRKREGDFFDSTTGLVVPDSVDHRFL